MSSVREDRHGKSTTVVRNMEMAGDDYSTSHYPRGWESLIVTRVAFRQVNADNTYSFKIVTVL
jgi:hypothetical protein